MLEVLLQQLAKVPGVAAALHDALDHKALHALRTPQVGFLI